MGGERLRDAACCCREGRRIGSGGNGRRAGLVRGEGQVGREKRRRRSLGGWTREKKEGEVTEAQ